MLNIQEDWCWIYKDKYFLGCSEITFYHRSMFPTNTKFLFQEYTDWWDTDQDNWRIVKCEVFKKLWYEILDRLTLDEKYILKLSLETEENNCRWLVKIYSKRKD